MAPRNHVLLVNPNRMRPPIAPLALDYLAPALERRGYQPVLCDLAFADDWAAALAAAVEDTDPVALAFSVRNLDDAYYASQDFVLEQTAAMVRHAMTLTGAPVILGGVGFSIAPADVLAFTGAHYGIAGEGEGALPDLLDCLAAGADPATVPGAVFREAGTGRIVANPARYCALDAMPVPPRRFVDNLRYFAEGGQAGVETKRGCARPCIYCVEPHAKGNANRLRNPDDVAEEFANLLDQGVDTVHLCDSEFNLPPDHARAVCDALVRKGLHERMRWYVYAYPKPFDEELANAMARAGCSGVNFGVDHTDPRMLRRLGRDYGPDDIRATAQAVRDAGMAFMFDMLLGGPGETRESIASAIVFMQDLGPDRVGLSCGVRVYPNTALAAMVRAQAPLERNPNLHGTTCDNDSLLRPVFYVDQAIGNDIHSFVASLAGGDSRFLHADPGQLDGNYNYNDNSVLANAIRQGERGAYWDILRRIGA